MSSADKPTSSNPVDQHQEQQQSQTANTKLSESEVALLLEQKDREIHALKFELEKYKLALHQSQLGYRYFQQQQQIQGHDSGTLSKDNIENLLVSDEGQFDPKPALVSTIATNSNQAYSSEKRQRLVSGGSEEASDTAIGDSSVSKESIQSTRMILNRQSITSACSNVSASSSKVAFKPGIDDDEDMVTRGRVDEDRRHSISENNLRDMVSDDLQDIIQDIGEIDLDLDFDVEQGTNERSISCRLSDQLKQVSRDEVSDDENISEEERIQGSNHGNEDMISDGLLTSLTDAVISNLSQLAALQERCESQQHSQYQQHSNTISRSQPTEMNSNNMSSQAATSIPSTRVSVSNSICLGPIGRTSQMTMNTSDIQDPVGFEVHDSFSPTTRQATAAAIVSKLQNSASIVGKTDSSSSSNSTNSTLQVDHGRSLASAFAAAAVAAAAANDQQNQHHRPTHQIQSTPQSRLISSALASSEFYHSLHQQQHAQQTNLQHQMSPVSSLHFSPSTSITPSPSSLLGASRRSASNTSSSLLSPIASPSYLRRQFMQDRLTILSPSPTSLTTGSTSYNSSSLAHILQQHSNHSSQQQRSASALAGPITSPTGTSISGTGSTAMSPLMSSKNSSQARLNNMQIRHKFGYLGSGRAQFNSPHGFCLGLNQEIVVADTNNHRVCIFDKSGSYITQFGSPGKEEGQLWNPRKVAILHRPTNSTNSTSSGNSSQAQQQSNRSSQGQVSTSYSSQFASEPLFVVCDRGAERSRMQLFTKDGAFIKKIGIHYIDIVAGLAITQDGLIIVVDSVSPTVYIINGETGSLNGWFDCSGHMKEPSDIAVKSDAPRNEYFICDFKGHCVVVFSEQGDYLRKIGHDGLTSYPNGIDISDDGDILVGDSHGNRFHVVVFDRNGNFVSQFECPHVKVSRCCGLKITREGYIVTLAKNNHHVLVLDTIHI